MRHWADSPVGDLRTALLQSTKLGLPVLFSLDAHSDPLEQALLLSLFYRWENLSSGKITDLPRSYSWQAQSQDSFPLSEAKTSDPDGWSPA